MDDGSNCWDWKWSRLDRNKGLDTIDDVKAGKVELPRGAEPEKHSVNDFSLLKLPHDYLKNPAFEAGHSFSALVSLCGKLNVERELRRNSRSG